MTPPLTPEQLEGLLERASDWSTNSSSIMARKDADFALRDYPTYLPSLLARIRELETCLEPFAKIQPSSFFNADGSENEGYHAIIVGDGSAEFTGRDLARARSALNRSTDNA